MGYIHLGKGHLFPIPVIKPYELVMSLVALTRELYGIGLALTINPSLLWREWGRDHMPMPYYRVETGLYEHDDLDDYH